MAWPWLWFHYIRTTVKTNSCFVTSNFQKYHKNALLNFILPGSVFIVALAQFNMLYQCWIRLSLIQEKSTVIAHALHLFTHRICLEKRRERRPLAFKYPKINVSHTSFIEAKREQMSTEIWIHMDHPRKTNLC